MRRKSFERMQLASISCTIRVQSRKFQSVSREAQATFMACTPFPRRP